MFFTARRGRRYYKSDGDASAFGGFLTVALIVVALAGMPIGMWWYENAHEETLKNLEVLLEKDFVNANTKRLTVGTPVWLQSKDVDTMAKDDDFGVSVLGAVGARRSTQYCQWTQHSTRRCQQCAREVTARDGTSSTETYDCNCVVDYSYFKTWHPHRIPSIFYDQPASHHNPQRDPYPSRTFIASDATLKDVKARLDSNLLSRTRAGWRNIRWTPGGRAPSEPTGWFSWLSPKTTTARYEAMSPMMKSRNQNDGFVYVGDGTFYSAYEPSTAQRLFKAFFQYAEGSLFDWQLGDLIPSCTAGDIKISYSVQDPSEISVLAAVVSKDRGGYVSLGDGSDFEALVHSGLKTPEEMIRVETSDARRQAFLVRIAFFSLWAIPAAFLSSAYFGFDLWHFGSYYLGILLASFSVWATVQGIIWTSVREKSLPSILFFVGGIALFTLVVKEYAPPSHAKPGLRAVWCMIARAASLPPQWRQEEGYRPEHTYYQQQHPDHFHHRPPPYFHKQKFM